MADSSVNSLNSFQKFNNRRKRFIHTEITLKRAFRDVITLPKRKELLIKAAKLLNHMNLFCVQDWYESPFKIIILIIIIIIVMIKSHFYIIELYHLK